jgi:hypothetical protein
MAAEGEWGLTRGRYGRLVDRAFGPLTLGAGADPAAS